MASEEEPPSDSSQEQGEDLQVVNPGIELGAAVTNQDSTPGQSPVVPVNDGTPDNPGPTPVVPANPGPTPVVPASNNGVPDIVVMPDATAITEPGLLADFNAASEASARDLDNPQLVREMMKAKNKLDEFRNERIQQQISLLLANNSDRSKVAKVAKPYKPTVPNLKSKLKKLRSKKEPEEVLDEEEDTEVEVDASAAAPDAATKSATRTKKKKAAPKSSRVTRASLADSDGFEDLEFSDDDEDEDPSTAQFDSGVRIPAPVPIIKEGCSYKEYEESVEIWVATVTHRIPQRQQALLLLAELPNTEKSGSLRTRVKDEVGLAKLQSKNGVPYLLAAIRHIKDAPTFVRLVAWMRVFTSFRQKAGWSNDFFIHEMRKMLRTGEEEFGFTLPATFKAHHLL